MPEAACPLCSGGDCESYLQDRRRSYWRCGRCQLVFVDPSEQLSPERERAEYDLHENDPRDPGYRRFLSRLAIPLQRILPRGARGLDFGSGPGPTLASMMAEAGWPMELYDPFYADDRAQLERCYDFITATEVIEHVRDPAAVLPALWRILSPGGTLALMTKLVIDREAFSRWHYKNDMTHVCFYSQATFRYLGAVLPAQVEFVDEDVTFLHKPS